MSQDRESGAKASEWGHQTARRLAEKLGAVDIGVVSNECRWNGNRIVIKCAKAGTTSVGVTYRMLEHLDHILGAFELDDGSFEAWSITPAQFESAMRESRSRGGIGKTALVSRSFFQQHGKHVARLHT
jgi:hypothetical protein